MLDSAFDEATEEGRRGIRECWPVGLVIGLSFAITKWIVSATSLFTLTDRAERDDHCARVYNKSLLYLVAHAFEATARNWIDRSRRHGTRCSTPPASVTNTA